MADAGSVNVTGGTNNPAQTIDYTAGTEIGVAASDAAQAIDTSFASAPSQIDQGAQVSPLAI